jgi:hypothetical protein
LEKYVRTQGGSARVPAWQRCPGLDRRRHRQRQCGFKGGELRLARRTPLRALSQEPCRQQVRRPLPSFQAHGGATAATPGARSSPASSAAVSRRQAPGRLRAAPAAAGRALDGGRGRGGGEGRRVRRREQSELEPAMGAPAEPAAVTLISHSPLASA